MTQIETIVADALMMACDDAQACSHRPEMVRALILDANARYCLAAAVLAALEPYVAANGWVSA